MNNRWVNFRSIGPAVILSAILGLPLNQQVFAQGAVLEEIMVTARRREESLQAVPDAVTAFTSDTLEDLGIDFYEDFLDLVPNLSFRDGRAYRKGDSRLALRGIGNGQQGWPSVTYVVDGVPANSLDSVFSGSLIDIERIEVLRGPQSALYGAGAIAGAINVVTRRPSDEFRFKTKVGYGKGDDKRVDAMVSGPLAEGKAYYRLVGSFRDWDGLIDSASNGLDLDFEDHKSIEGQLLFTPTENLEFLVKASYLEEETGSTYQDKTAPDVSVETFNRSTDPRRRFAGDEDRELINLSLRAQWELPWATLVSVTGYSDIDQDIYSSVCWDDPNNPAVDTDPVTPGGQVGCVFSAFFPAFGDSAAPGQSIDHIFDSLDNFESWTQDVRIISPTDSRFRWLAGAQIIEREAYNGFDMGITLAPDSTFVNVFPSWDEREDFWWGVYGQLQLDITEQLELTFAARYDDTESKNTRYVDRGKVTTLQVLDTTGMLIDTQEINDDAFQPKVQLSYQLNDDMNVYFTWSEGYRAGFFNTGNFTLAEDTENIEGGIKSTWFDQRLRLNLSVFQIDYSDQQFSTISPEPPFRIAVTIPQTDIFGVEAESTLVLNEYVTLSGSVGYLDSEQQAESGDLTSPYAPEWTVNLIGDFTYPSIYGDWDLRFTTNFDHSSSMFLAENEGTPIESKDFLNLRLGMENENWRVTLWGKNVLDTRMVTTQQFLIAGGNVRAMNRPESYGVEIQYTY